jgi:hypothetical protein
MMTIAEVSQWIASGKALSLAGDEKVLRQLPKGNWIAGTIPYFMGDNGGLFTQDAVYVDEIPSFATGAKVVVFDKDTIKTIYSAAPDNGYTLAIFPAGCPTLLDYSLHGPEYDHFAASPVAGWAAGVFLAELGKVTPKVFDGTTGRAYEDGCVALQVSLPENFAADIEILNIFEQGEGDVFTFDDTSFSVTHCYVNGKKHHLRTYLNENKIDIRFPLVGNAFGAMLNVSFQAGTEGQDDVAFYAPVFKGMEYRLAKPVANYVQEFDAAIPAGIGHKTLFSCNCILNYLYSELEGKKTADVTGPMTFGEIAYQLVNQTMVYLTVNRLN